MCKQKEHLRATFPTLPSNEIFSNFLPSKHSVIYNWKAYALKFLKLQNLDQIHCTNIELDFC